VSWLDDLQADDPAYPAPGAGDPWQAPPTADWAALAAAETAIWDESRTEVRSWTWSAGAS